MRETTSDETIIALPVPPLFAFTLFALRSSDMSSAQLHFIGRRLEYTIASLSRELHLSVEEIRASLFRAMECTGQPAALSARTLISSTPPPISGVAPKPFALGAIDVLAQADSIARSASGENVDWSREPLSERECAIRARYIKNHLGSLLGCIGLGRKAEALRLRQKPIASDLAAADVKAAAILKQDHLDGEREEFREIANELDGEAAS